VEPQAFQVHPSYLQCDVAAQSFTQSFILDYIHVHHHILVLVTGQGIFFDHLPGFPNNLFQFLVDLLLQLLEFMANCHLD
jgi:hypothetical protein